MRFHIYVKWLQKLKFLCSVREFFDIFKKYKMQPTYIIMNEKIGYQRIQYKYNFI